MTRLQSVNWCGHFNTITGYGNVNLLFPLALQKKGVNVSLGWERYGENHMEWRYLSQEQKELMNKPFQEAHVGIIKSLPTQFHACTNKFRIGYTMVENTRVNSEWIRLCNEMDAMLVPSEFLVPVFKESGLTVPIRAIRQGIQSEVFPFFDRSERVVNTFIFGTVGYMDDRKNWKDLLSAFISEFDQGEPVELWIKNTNREWGFFNLEDDRIKIIPYRYTDTQMNDLYRLMDCFVCPSHAEGSGLTPREAMATGLPTILTDWSGLTEVSDPKISYPLTPVAIDHPDFRGEEQPGFQARIDVRELMYYMRWVYEHRIEALHKGKKASEFVHREYSWDKCADVLIEKVEELCG